MIAIALTRPPLVWEAIDLEVRSASPEALFAEVAIVFCNQVAPASEIVPRELRVLQLAAPRLEDLLLAWLRELRTIFETEGALFSRIEVDLQAPGDAAGWELRARLWGESFDVARHLRRQQGSLPDYDQVEITHPARDESVCIARVWQSP
jgi:SHS2 domain-containing protein